MCLRSAGKIHTAKRDIIVYKTLAIGKNYNIFTQYRLIELTNYSDELIGKKMES